MKRISLALLALAAALAIAPVALADPLVSGTIGVTAGNDSWTLLTDTTPGITFKTTGGFVADITGDFAVIPLGTAVTLPSTLLFNSPAEVLFTVGADLATFTITSLTVSRDTGTFLDISGTGDLGLAGYASTPATFNLDSTDSSGQFGVNSSTFGIDAVPTPEPSILLLLGTGLFGLAFAVFKKALVLQS